MATETGVAHHTKTKTLVDMEVTPQIDREVIPPTYTKATILTDTKAIPPVDTEAPTTSDMKVTPSADMEATTPASKESSVHINICFPIGPNDHSMLTGFADHVASRRSSSSMSVSHLLALPQFLFPYLRSSVQRV